MNNEEVTLRAMYEAFNALDVDSVLELMHREVDWPNAWEGGRVVGRESVAAYWTRQFKSIQSIVEPERFDFQPDGSILVTVHQTVRDAHTNDLLSDARVLHRYRLADGLVVSMDVEDPPG